MNALRIHTEIKRVDDIFDNLTERKCHDRKVIALKTEHRYTDQKTEESRNRSAD